jgi:hypothetical protein
VTAPPEVLQWARTALNGLSSLDYKARFEGLKIDSEIWQTLASVERQLIAFMEEHGTTDPEKWVDKK